MRGHMPCIITLLVLSARWPRLAQIFKCPFLWRGHKQIWQRGYFALFPAGYLNRFCQRIKQRPEKFYCRVSTILRQRFHHPEVCSDKSLTLLTYDIWHLNVWTFEYLNIWRFEDLKSWTFEHLNIWTFEHLNIRSFEHWEIGILERWNIRTLEHWNIGTWTDGPMDQ